VGAFFAPHAAKGILNWWLKVNGFGHDASLPSLCHQYINGTLIDTSVFQQLADNVNMGGPVTDLGSFASHYLEAFSKGYNYAFGIAAIAMVISLLVYVFFNKRLPNKEKKVTAAAEKVDFKPSILFAAVVTMGVTAFILQFITKLGDSPAQRWATGLAFGLFTGFVTWIILSSRKEERARIIALVLVFVVVIFFWMSFHQNGLTQSLFARDYTVKQVGPFTNLFFTLPSMLAVIGAVAGLVLLVYRKIKIRIKISGGALFLVALLFALYFTNGFDPTGLLDKLFIPFGLQNSISPEIFQSFNPLFIVALTFPVMAAFSWLNKKGIEPSTPKKIGIGMIIAALGFVVVLIASIGVPSPASLAGAPVSDVDRVSPYWLMSSYLTLTIAELFLSPMGLSFVSKVAPSRFQGLMQGGWLLATAVGNKLLFIGTLLWDKVALTTLWLVFICCCLVSAAFIFSILRRLEKAAGS
jgi:POT family proton-dependent oligopeptide transporter